MRLDVKYFILTIIVFLNLVNITKASDSSDSSNSLDFSNSLEIFAPDKRVCTNKNNMMIVGKTDAKIVDIFLNGKLIDNKLVVDGFFHHQIEFGYGLHEVKIIPVYSEKSNSDTDFSTIEIMYAPMIDRKYKRLYPDYSYHSNEVDPVCLTCHKLNFANLNEVDDSNTCLDCHISLKESFSKHTQGNNKTCLMCHQLSSNLKAIIDEQNKEKNPCYKCHDDKIKSFDREYVHGPIAGGSCMICHSMHGSKNEHHLNFPESMLCFECHDDVEEQINLLTVHKPFMEGNCVGCHDPHSTNNEWILKKSSEEICLACHDPKSDLKDHKHPFNVEPKKKKVLNDNLILTSDGKLECLTCHNPHSSRRPFMLKTNKDATCLGCHNDLL